MYNLTVADTHMYYVVAGAAAVLVHNSKGRQCDVNFPDSVKREAVDQNLVRNDGELRCEYCNQEIIPAEQSRRA